MSEQSVQHHNQIFNIFPVQFSHETMLPLGLGLYGYYMIP
jgi:hypothetical protein